MPLSPQTWPNAAVLAFLFFTAGGRAAELPLPVYHGETSEVRIGFLATDEHGRPQTNLKKDDFAIIDDGVVIRNFSSLNEADEGFDIVVLLDASESVAHDFRQMANAAWQLVSEKELTFDTSISLMTFSGVHSAILCHGNCRDSHSTLLSITPNGGTPLLDAISDASLFLSHHHPPVTKPVIVVFSDGIDTSSDSSIQEVMRGLINSQIVLYAVDVGAHRSGTNGSTILHLMAEGSGGKYFLMGRDTNAALANAFGELRHAYVVTYKPENAAIGYHSLHILPTHNLSLQFHSQSGYFYGADQ